MSKLDQFESVFRSAERERFEYGKVPIRTVLVVTDLSSSAADEYLESIRGYLSVVEVGEKVEWRVLDQSDFRSAGDLLEKVSAESPDLICTYRNLHSRAWRWRFSLGEHLDVLTQMTNAPVMVLPHPEAGYAGDHALVDTNSVMVMTNHLTGDHRLVNYGARFTERGGTLFLSHVEDDRAFEHMMHMVAKIPSIDTTDARELLREQLIKEPTEYIRSCAEVLSERGFEIQVDTVVVFGSHVGEYRRLVEEHQVDLLVLHTRDEEQLAMHGRAYPLAVELRQIPLLML